MKIIKTKPEKMLEHIQNRETFIDNVISRISSLIKTDSEILIGSKLEKAEFAEKNLINQELKYSSLLIKSEEIKKETENNLSSLKAENSVIRKKLLEMLGNE